MKASELMLKARLVAAMAISPSRPIKQQIEREGEDFEEHLQAVGTAVAQQAAHERPIEPAAAPEVEFAAIFLPHHQHGVGDDAKPERDDGRQARPRDAHLGKAAIAEDQEIIQDAVEDRGERIDDHGHAGLAAADEERGQRGGDDLSAGAEGHGLIENRFQPGHFRFVSRPGENQRGQRNGGQEDRNAGDADPNALPDGGADALRPIRPVVLRDEGVHVQSDAQRKADQREVQHSGGQHGGHFVRSNA